jgi:hypothetical protein
MATRAVPVRLLESWGSEGRDVIGDERRGWGLATIDDVLTMRDLYANRMHGKSLRHREYVVKPKISGGTWTFRCPDCGPNYSSVATPGLPTVVCSTCSGEFSATFPKDRIEIERLLLARPDVYKRNWNGETVDALREENQTLGVRA